MFDMIVLFGTLTIILLAAGWLLGGLLGMLIFLFIAAAVNFVTYWYSDRLVLKMYRARPADDRKLLDIVKKLAHETKVPTPKVYIVDSDVPNAFATGRNPKHSSIAVTRGIMRLSGDEMEAVLAHEMAHIRNRDIMVSAMAATIAGAISYIAQIGYWSLFLGGERRGEGSLVGLLFIIIFAPLAAFLVRMAISRKREYKADYTGAVITKNPGALASALRKISDMTRQHPMKMGSSATSHLWIVNPFHRDWFTSLFNTHPPIQKRIERLEHMEARG